MGDYGSYTTYDMENATEAYLSYQRNYAAARRKRLGSKKIAAEWMAWRNNNLEKVRAYQREYYRTKIAPFRNKTK